MDKPFDEPLYFGEAGERMFGMLARAGEAGARDLGVVFCHPYGEEKQFSYRIFVRFAHELQKRGVSSLRFDCRGYGDSDGLIEEATVESQVTDTLAAIDVAQAQLGVRRVALLGLRLGGLVAALAAEQTAAAAGLVLWSPITDGKSYVRELIRKKLFGLISAGESKKSEEEIRRELEDSGRTEIQGNYFTREMSEQLAAVKLAETIETFSSPVLITTHAKKSGTYTALDELTVAYQGRGAACTMAPLEDKEYWDEWHLTRWLFPQQVFDATLEWLCKV